MDTEEEDEWGDFENELDGTCGWGDTEAEDTSTQMKLDLVEAKSKPHETITSEQVKELMENQVKEFGSMLGSEPPWEDARLLLQFYGWDAERATNEYFMGDQTNARINAGLDASATSMDAEETELECPICLDDKPASEFASLTCGHDICKECWTDYVRQAMKNKNCFRLKCPMESCKVAVTTCRLRQIGIPGPAMEQIESRMGKFRVQNFIEANSSLQMCLGTDCPLAQRLFVPRKELSDITCRCGHVYCIKCLNPGHRPAPCDIADLWLEKATSEAENMQWILARTKKCPKCRVPIEKNQGCNHMNCQSCRHQFCWLCKGDWKDHGTATGGFYKCNIYEANKVNGTTSEEDLAQEDANSELERYTFHYTRYENHMNAIAQMKKTTEVAQARMGELMSKYQWKPNEVTFIKDASTTIIECRRLLAWTYPIGYYMEKGFSYRHLFLDYQQNLEKFTEHLHELAEQPLEKFETDPNARTELINNQRVIQKYRDNLLKGIETEINPLCKFGRKNIR